MNNACLKTLLASVLLLLSACESTYYNAMEQVGIHKRDILIDRIEDTQDAQQDGQEQFKSALEQFKSVVNFDGGELEKLYNKLNDEYEYSEKAAESIRDHIDDVESVAEALFDEWEDELEQYSSQSLRRDSQRKLGDTRRQYKNLLASMQRAEQSIDPVLNTMRDQVLYLKHNLNARAIASLKGELATINKDINRLIANMQKAIDESERFIRQLKGN
jgi:hypothetical protein